MWFYRFNRNLFFLTLLDFDKDKQKNIYDLTPIITSVSNRM